MSIATGRDPVAMDYLLNPPPSVQITIPSICCMEAFSALEDERKRRNRFDNELRLQISQLKRDLTSSSARSLLYIIRQSINENQSLLNDIEDRLFHALDAVAMNAELIDLTPAIIVASRNNVFISDPTDNLILHCVLKHANFYENENKAFMSGNVKDFDMPAPQEALQEAGVGSYFRRMEDFVGWWESQQNT